MERGSSSPAASRKSIAHLFLRADASFSMGTGHLMRCLALAQAANEKNAKPIFLIREAPPRLLAKLKSEGFPYCLLRGSPELASEVEEVMEIVTPGKRGNWIVLDGYHFDAAYQSAYRAQGLSVAVIDDYGHSSFYEADVVLNPNLYASMNFYPNCADHTEFLLGSSYALLRKEFWPWRKFQRDIPAIAQKLLITMGGSDPTNVTHLVMNALRCAPVAEIEVTIVLGSANQRQDEIAEQVKGLAYKVRLIHHADDMAKLLAATDLAVSAAGSTVWELLFMQVPAILFSLPDDNENQRRLAESVALTGAASDLGRAGAVNVPELIREIHSLMQDGERRQKMAKRGRELIDGYGARRVIRYLRQVKAKIAREQS